MASTGKTFRATESVGSLLQDLLSHQFPDHIFSMVLLPYHEREGILYYDIHINALHCPDEIQIFIDDSLARLFSIKSRTRLQN